MVFVELDQSRIM